MDKIIEITGLQKKDKNFNINNINFYLQTRHIMGFIGENGAGKTTTIKMILNSIEKTSGEIKVFGYDHQREEVKIKKSIGYVPADEYFIQKSNLIQHANAMKIFYKDWDDELFESLCKSWDLPLKSKIYTYSTGMRKKAMLALALAHRPKLLILDEITSGLDPLSRIEVLDILKLFVKNGNRSVLFSTHIIADLEKIADDIVLIHKGEVVDQIPIHQIQEKYLLVEIGKDKVVGKQDDFIGYYQTDKYFTGIMLRDKAEKLFDKMFLKLPTIEELLVYTIRRVKNEESEAIIKGL